MIWITSTKKFKRIRCHFCLYRLWVLIVIMFAIAASVPAAESIENVTSSKGTTAEIGTTTTGNKNDGQCNFMVQEKYQ